MVSLIVEEKRTCDEFIKGEVTVYTAQASFFIVLSFFPFIILSSTLIQFIPNINKSDLMTTTVAAMPDMLDSFVVGIIDDLYTKSPATIVSITAITVLRSAFRGMLSVERSLNRVNEIPRRRNYTARRVICAGCTIVFIFAHVGSLIFLMLGSSLQRLIDRLFSLVEEIISFIVSFHSMAAMAISIVTLMALYACLSSINQRSKDQVPGAPFSTIGQTIFPYPFSMYFSHLNSFSCMYENLTATMLLMPWLYICICILLIRMEINYHYMRNYRQWEVEIS